MNSSRKNDTFFPNFVLLLSRPQISNCYHHKWKSSNSPCHCLSFIKQPTLFNSDCLWYLFRKRIIVRLDHFLNFDEIFADINISVRNIRSNKISALFIWKNDVKLQLHELSRFWKIIWRNCVSSFIYHIRHPIRGPILFNWKSSLFCPLHTNLHS